LTRDILIDGVAWAPSQNGTGLSTGARLDLVETTQWQTDAADLVADCSLARTVIPGEVRHDVAITGNGQTADVEWLYAGMLPMVHWDGETGSQVFDTVKGVAGAEVMLADYAGQTPPNVPLGDGGRIGLAGQIDMTALRYGLEVKLVGGSAQAPDGLEGFLRPNLDGRVASGTLDWMAKAYVAADKSGGLQISNGEKIGFVSRHVISAF